MKNMLILTLALVLPLLGSLSWSRAGRSGVFSVAAAGRLGLALVLIMTGSAHFTRTEGIMKMIPEWIPAAREIIWVTGVLEILAAIGLLVKRTVRITGRMLILYFIAVFPVNVWAALNRVDFGGNALGPLYLLVRGPFQALLIFWAWKFAVADEETKRGI